MARWRPDEADLLGWHPVPGNKHVCAACFGDYAIKEFIEAEACAPACSYCGLSRSDATSIAADMDDVVEFILEGLQTEWTDPAEKLPYESREGGYQGCVLDTNDVLARIWSGWSGSADVVISDLLTPIAGHQQGVRPRGHSSNAWLGMPWRFF